jgi:TolA-binding protein
MRHSGSRSRAWLLAAALAPASLAGVLSVWAGTGPAPRQTPPAPATSPAQPRPATTTPAKTAPSAAAADAPLDARLYSEAAAALAAGRRDEAARILRRVYSEFPDSPWAPAALLKAAEMIYPVTAWKQIGSASGAALQQAGDLLGRLAQSYRNAPEAAQALVRLGYIGLEPARAKADLDEACGRFATVLPIYPDSGAADDAALAAGLCDQLRGRPARAAGSFERLLGEHPDSPLAGEALYRYGLALSRLDDASEAMLALERVRLRAPDSPFAGPALDRLTLLHRMRLLPPEPATRAGGAAPVDWSTLYRVDNEYGAAPSGDPGAAKTIRGINDLSVDAQGLLVAASPRTPAVFRFDARGRVQEQITHPGPDHVAAAEGLAVFISGKEQIAVNARNWSGADLPGAGGRPPTDYGPIAVDAFGRVHLLDRRENAVLVYDRNRRLVAAARPPAGREGRFIDVAASDDGSVLVLDDRSRLVVALSQGRETRRIDLSASGIAAPAALAVDGLGDLYILDARTGAVVVTDPAGRPLSVIRLPKETASRVGEVGAIAVDAQGRVYLGGRKSGALVRLQ